MDEQGKNRPRQDWNREEDKLSLHAGAAEHFD